MKNFLDVVLDTNILVSALWSFDGNPARIVEMVLAGDITSHYSNEILAEYKKVLFRDRFKSRFAEGEINILLDYIVKFGNRVSPAISKEPFFVDESDRIFYDVAKEVGAVLIIGNII